MERTPFPNFWKEEPVRQKTAWRPTDQSCRKLRLIGYVQFILLIAIICVAMLIAKESKRMPAVYAQLPNGLVFETKPIVPEMHRLARMNLVNEVLNLLYYQEGGNHYLAELKPNVKMTILSETANNMSRIQDRTNNTIQLNIVETFETAGGTKGNRAWFEAMTKATLIRRDKKSQNDATIYLRTHWEFENDRYILSGLMESKPGEYYEAFLREKERLHNLKPEELERELNIRRNEEIPIPERKSGKL